MELEELERQIEIETLAWNELGLHPGSLRHEPESIWVLKLQVQAMMNVLLNKGLIANDELDLEHKRILLNDMKLLKEEFQRQRREALLANTKLVDKSGRKFRS